jgi:hypothetical protein
MGLFNELGVDVLDQEQVASVEPGASLAEFDEVFQIVARYKYANHSALNKGAISRDVYAKARALRDAVKVAEPSGDVQPFECERVTKAVILAGKLLADRAEDSDEDGLPSMADL